MKFHGLLFIYGSAFVVCCLFVLVKPVNALLDHQRLPCTSLSTDLAIPNDGSWLQICLTDPDAPEGLAVTEMNVKLLLDHPDPGRLEILLSRTDSDIVLSLSPAEIAKDGTGRFINIHDFNGLPSMGEWIIRIRDTQPGAQGSLMDASIVAFYLPAGESSIASSENNGKPTSARLAEDAVKITAGIEGGEKGDTEGSLQMHLGSLDSVAIMTQTFEGPFPPVSGGWEIYDANPNDGKEYYWDDDNLRPYSGSWAAWPARGGADGIDPTLSSTYPGDMDTWMIYGPFDLSNAKAAQVDFMLWRQIEVQFDNIFFGISSDHQNFYGWAWDNNSDWENVSIDLGSFLGDSDVWIGWHFVSDSTIQYAGPWIDDIALTITPADVMVEGQFRYYDRRQNPQPARDVTYEIWDRDYNSDDDLLYTGILDWEGYLVAPDIPNWDEDEAGATLAERRLDLYVRWKSENPDLKVTTFGGNVYIWQSPLYPDIASGVHKFNSTLPFAGNSTPAMWIFQDMRQAREFYLVNTYPFVDPGYLTVHWEIYQDAEWPCPDSCFRGTHVFIAHSSIMSGDAVVHELGHHVMFNQTGQWFISPDCLHHELFIGETAECAWYEGWADFFPLAVNGDGCYDFDQFSCTGDYQNLEAHSRNDNPAVHQFGDNVEGRVAGALYDLMDADNEYPWFDDAAWGFDWIADVAMDYPGRSIFNHFYYATPVEDRHLTLRAIWQNTIDYNLAPSTGPIPQQRTLQNAAWNHLLDLNDYTSDLESPNWLLEYTFVSQSNPNCGVGFDYSWVDVSPAFGWVGSCTVTYEVSDSLEPTSGSFEVQVLPITSRVYLPIVCK